MLKCPIVTCLFETKFPSSLRRHVGTLYGFSGDALKKMCPFANGQVTGTCSFCKIDFKSIKRHLEKCKAKVLDERKERERVASEQAFASLEGETAETLPEEMAILEAEVPPILEDFRQYMTLKMYAQTSIKEHMMKAKKGIYFLMKEKRFSFHDFLSEKEHCDLLLRSPDIELMARAQNSVVMERNILRSFRVFLRYVRYMADRDFDVTSPRFVALEANVSRILTYMEDLEDIARKKVVVKAKERHLRKDWSFEFRPEDCHLVLKNYLSSPYYKNLRKCFLSAETTEGREVGFRDFLLYSLLLEVGGHRGCAILNLTLQEFEERKMEDCGKWRIIVKQHKTADTSGGALLFVKSDTLKLLLQKWADVRGDNCDNSDKFFVNAKGESMAVIRPAIERLRVDMKAAGMKDAKDPEFLTIGGPSIRKMNVFIGYENQENRANVAQLMCHSEEVQRSVYYFDQNGKNKSKGHDLLHAALHSPSEASSSSEVSSPSEASSSSSPSEPLKRKRDESSSSSSSSTKESSTSLEASSPGFTTPDPHPPKRRTFKRKAKFNVKK